MKRGRILKAISGFYYVDTGGETVVCKARGKFRKLKIKPIVGDMTEIQQLPDGTGYLLDIAPRKNQLTRPLISNIDMIAIVVSQAPPVTDTFLIDRVSVTAESQSIPVTIVINKCDLDEGNKLYNIYTHAGFTVFRVSGETHEGISDLRQSLIGKLTAFTGISGVGKSTVLNQILPAATLETGEINEKIGRGRHTTRQVELIKISDNTWVADTPGFSAFDTERMDLNNKDELSDFFIDFSPYSKDCRFVGCSHIKDNGCEVVRAVKQGKIEKTRHQSYVRLFESIKDVKDWERKDL